MSKPIIPWIGGKRKLVPEILPLFPAHQCYVEPFAGGAALFFMKEPSETEVLNDINGDIINLYRVVKHHLEELYKQFKWVLTSRENWELLKMTPVETLTDVQRAARFLYLQKLAFGGMADSDKQTFGTATTGRPRFNIYNLEQDLADAHFRLHGAVIENLSWEKTIEKYDRPHTLFYCDPPYWQTEGYGCEFGWAHYEKMAELAKTIKGDIIISINDHPDIRELFSFMECKEISYKYTCGGNGNAQDVIELIYGTFKRPPARQQQKLF